MENTCDFKNCPVAKRMKLKNENECPNFVESWWTPEGIKKPVVVKDCSPKRTFLMIQDLYNRLIGVQKSQEQMRNAYDTNQAFINLLTENIQMNFEKLLTQPREIEERRKPKLLDSKTINIKN